MADAKISALPASTTPLAGTEILPIVQSNSTKQVSISNVTAGRTVAMRNADLTGGAAVINIGATGDNTYHYVRTIDNDGQAVYLGNDNAAGSFFGAGAYGRVLYSEGAKPLKVFVNGAYRAEYDTSGNYKLNTGNLVQGTAAKGINFTANTPAAGMTSQLLNWYEEGTWTPTLTFSTLGDLAITYDVNNRVGSYTRIGNRVMINFSVRTTSYTFTTAGGNLEISGLPFTSGNVGEIVSCGSLIWAGITKAGYTQVTTRIPSNTNSIFFVATASALATSSVTATDTPSGGTMVLRGSVTYQV